MPWRHMGEWRYNSTILDLSTGWRWLVSFTPRALYSRGKSPLYPLYRRLGGPQSRSGHCGVEKNLLQLPGIEPCRPVRSPSLYQCSYPGSLKNLYRICKSRYVRQTCAPAKQQYRCVLRSFLIHVVCSRDTIWSSQKVYYWLTSFAVEMRHCTQR
jgi:hypothetical protein